MKTAKTIYEAMLARFTEATGFAMEDEADLAVRLYAAAAQLETLYAYADWTLAQAFPQTAEGDYLDYHGALRGVTRQAGVCASGTLRFSVEQARTADLTVAAGTVCTTAGLVRFVTTEAAVIPAGSLYGDAPAEAQEPGAAGNAAAGTVTLLSLAPAGVQACTNPTAFTGGRDREDDAAFRARVLDTFVRLPNGANAAYYENRVLGHSGVAAVKVIPRISGIGTVGVVVAKAGGPADAALLEEIRADLESVREIAVDVTVLAPTTVPVNVAASLTPAKGVGFETAKAAVQAALAGWFTGSRLGQSVRKVALGNLIYGTGLVENYALTAPAADVEITATQLPALGTVTLTEDA